MEGQRTPSIQNQVVLRIERDRVSAVEPQLAGSPDLISAQRATVGVDGFRVLALQTPQHRVVATMTVASRAERAKQL